jgi:anti-sigma-K factor RskA
MGWRVVAVVAVVVAAAVVAAAAAEGKVGTPCLIIMLSSLKFLLAIHPNLLLLHR